MVGIYKDRKTIEDPKTGFPISVESWKEQRRNVRNTAISYIAIGLSVTSIGISTLAKYKHPNIVFGVETSVALIASSLGIYGLKATHSITKLLRKMVKGS